MQNAPMVPAGGADLAAGPFAHQRYTVKRPAFSFLGRKYYVHAPDGSVVMFAKHPVMKLKQQFQVFTDDSEKVALMRLQQRSIMTLAPTYDVTDAASGAKVGVLRSQGLKSLFKDKWDVLDANEQPLGLVEQTSSVLLRFILRFLPSSWAITIGGQTAAEIKEDFMIFGKRYHLDLTNAAGKIDPRLALGATFLAILAQTDREARNG